MRPNRTVEAVPSGPLKSLGTMLSSHRAVTRVLLAAFSFTLIIAFSQQTPAAQAGPEVAPPAQQSLLPANVGVGISTDDAVTIAFDSAMNPGSVENAIQLLPAQPVELSWTEGLDQLTVSPERRWRTDESYVVVIGAGAARTDGTALARPARFAFTTQSAPTVSDIQVRLADGAPEPKLDAEAQAAAQARADAVLESDALRSSAVDEVPTTTTATDVSSSSAITVSFSAQMDRADVESNFAISPEIPGEISWDGNDLVFRPSERLEAGSRYTISVIGSHDRSGNLIGGKANFSFIVQPGAQVTKTLPEANAADVEPATVELWFSQPMDVDATNKAFGLTDGSTGALVGGNLNWNEAATQLVYTPDSPLAAGRTFTLAFEGGARDADGNRVETSLEFTTRAASAVASAPSVRTATAAPQPVVVAPSSSMAGYAVNQINASRAAYGFGPVVLDDSISAVAYAHAYDQAANGYFSHTGRDGSTRESRLRAGGVSFGWSGENQCYLVGRSVQSTLDWCHAQFMAEPYPGHWNHIANVLNPNARRVGVGIAQVGSRIVIVWDFTD